MGSDRLVQNFKDKVLFGALRLAMLLRHPRVSHWYWRVDPEGRLPNPVLPRNMNEKYFWRKLFDRNPELTKVSDKIKVRDWLVAKGIDVPVPRILWAGRRPEDIPDELFNQPVVAKANHGSGTNIMLHGPPEDREAFNRKLRKFIRKRQGRRRLEWAYFDIDRYLMIEEMLPDVKAEFKIYAFGERLERMVLIYDRFSGMAADVWLPDGAGGWDVYDGRAAVAWNRANRELPESTGKALQFARECGKHFDHMRIDILTDGKEIWFSEMTVYNMAGYLPVVGYDGAQLVNTSWRLQDSWFLNTPQSGWRGAYARALKRALA